MRSLQTYPPFSIDPTLAPRRKPQRTQIMTTTALSEALAKLRQLKVPNWPAGRILGDIADEIESALASAEPVAWQRRTDVALDGNYDDWCPISKEEYDFRLAILAGRDSCPMAGSFGCTQNPLREDKFGWFEQVRALYTHAQAAVRAGAVPIQFLKDFRADVLTIKDNPNKGDAVFRCGNNGAIDVVVSRIDTLIAAATLPQHPPAEPAARAQSGDALHDAMERTIARSSPETQAAIRGEAATTCWQHRPGSLCPTPDSCRSNGCSAVERELFPDDAHPSPAHAGVGAEALADFTEWLAREMPPGQ
jgi:hypothetical protein